MKVGVGFSQRDFCDGQSLASPGRWPPGSHVYPSSRSWASVVNCFMRFTNLHGTKQLLVSLAMGKVDPCPFPLDEVAELKRSLIGAAAGFGYQVERRPGDRSDVPVDDRFLNLLLRVAEDPETGLGEYAQGVKVGPGTRMPRLPALFKPKKKFRLASQVDPLDYLEHAPDKEGIWRRNCSTLQAFEQQVLEVMYDQSSRGQNHRSEGEGGEGQVSELGDRFTRCITQGEARRKVSARVLFDGTHGLCVNSRKRVRDQERAPIAADLKRSMRDKAKVDELTFALPADVTDAIHLDDWHYLGCQVIPGGDVYVNIVGTFGIASASY